MNETGQLSRLEEENRRLLQEKTLLEDHLELYRQAVASMHGMVWEKRVDARGEGRLETICMNDTTRLWPADRPFLDRVHPEDRPLLEERNMELLRGSRDHSLLDFRVEVEGGIRHVREEVRAVPLEEGVLLRGFTWDMTDLRRMEKEYRMEKDFLNAVLGGVPMIVSLADLRGRIQYMNEAGLAAYGYSPEEAGLVLGRPYWEIMAPDEKIGIHYQRLVADMALGILPEPGCQVTHRTRDGKPLHLRWYNSLIKNPEEETVLVSMGTDVGKLVEQQQRLKQNEERYRLALEGNEDSVVDYRMDCDEAVLSETWTRRFLPGESGDRITGFREKFLSVVDPSGPHRERAVRLFRDMLASERDELDTEIPLISGDGRPVWVRIRGRVFYDDGMRRFLGLASDNTELVRARERIEHQAYHDPLTNLRNRWSFLERAGAIMRREGAGNLFFLDIDDFKVVNDTHGHSAGDQVLVILARRLRQVFRQEDLICRSGGDEFLVFTGGKSDPEPVACRALESLNAPYRIGELSIRVTVSIGVVPVEGRDADLACMTARADRAMYQAKMKGKDTYHVCREEDGQEI